MIWLNPIELQLLKECGSVGVSCVVGTSLLHLGTKMIILSIKNQNDILVKRL